MQTPVSQDMIIPPNAFEPDVRRVFVISHAGNSRRQRCSTLPILAIRWFPEVRPEGAVASMGDFGGKTALKASDELKG